VAGGTFTPGVEKVRPGLYMNFQAKALARIQSGERGTVAIQLALNWGKPRTFLAINEEADTMKLLGYDYNSPEMLYVREAKKNAKTVLVYRLNGVGAGAVKATATWGTDNTATAKFEGTRGNDITIVSTPDVVDATKKLVQTMVDGRVVDEQTGVNMSDLKENDWVTWGGSGAIATTAGTKLTGGANGTVTNADHTDYLSATETQFIDTIAFMSNDPTLKTSFATFIKRMRDEEGKGIQGVAADLSADFEGIINVGNGVILNDGTALDALGAVAWVAGATAGASYTQSNTYKVYEGAVDANPRLKNSEIIAALKAGKFVFVHDGEKVKVEQDINSLVTYSQTKNQRFSKNRVIRVLDAIKNDLTKATNDSYIGKVDNNKDGQALLKDAWTIYFNELQDAGAIQNFDPKTDIFIDPKKSVGDQVFGTVGVQPVDSMEKFYFTVEVA
jgi:hypothetical protein